MVLNPLRVIASSLFLILWRLPDSTGKTGRFRLVTQDSQRGADQAFEAAFGGIGGHICYSDVATKE